MNALLVSDFNLENLAAHLRNHFASLEVEVSPFGQPVQTLLSAQHRSHPANPDFCVVWTRPESVLPSFAELLAGGSVALPTLYAEIDRFSDLLVSAARISPVVFVPLWVIPTIHLGHGLGDLAPGTGLVRATMAANLRLLERCADARHIHLLPAQNWIERTGETAFSPRLWYTGKIPFSNAVLKQAAMAIASGWDGIQGGARKLIITDLDDTLWGGTVGEVGTHGLVLGGHDPVGEAFVDFQRTLKAISRRGAALAIVSKNEESTALRAIREHPEMQLTLDDFAGWRINWNDKAENVAILARDLNLGLESIVFLDDNPGERARVREALPQVLVPELPEDPRLYSQAVLALTCFDKPAITQEDSVRSQMYLEERQRTDLRKAAVSLDEWLASLGTTVTVSPLTAGNAPRVTQLLNKTNQMNLRTRRMAEPELIEWLARPGREIWTIRARDRFGDSGIVGVVGLQTNDGDTAITDFLLSCRVMGRRIEETMLHLAVDCARKAGARSITAVYSPTPRNQPCLEFFRRSGFHPRTADSFTWNTTVPYPLDPAIHLSWSDEAGSQAAAAGALASPAFHG